MGKPQTVLTAKAQLELANETIEFLLQGYPYSDIKEYLTIRYSLSERQAKYAIKSAREQIIELGEFDLEMIIAQHIMNYEEAIRFFDEIGNFSAKATAMGAKEKLLKLYEDDTRVIEIENNINIDINNLDYSIDKLTEDEKQEFQVIFDKVKQLQ